MAEVSLGLSPAKEESPKITKISNKQLSNGQSQLLTLTPLHVQSFQSAFQFFQQEHPITQGYWIAEESDMTTRHQNEQKKPWEEKVRREKIKSNLSSGR